MRFNSEIEAVKYFYDTQLKTERMPDFALLNEHQVRSIRNTASYGLWRMEQHVKDIVASLKEAFSLFN